MNKPYKDKMGRYRARSLFWEMRDESMEPIWCMKDYDLVKGDITYPSLKKIYMAYDHVPGAEYDFAMEHFGSWDHWIKLCNSNDTSTRIKDMIQAWRNEIDIRIIEWAFNRSDSDFLTTIRILNGNHVYDFGVTRGYHFNLYRNLEINRNELILNLLKYKDDFLKMDYIFLSMWRNLFLSRL